MLTGAGRLRRPLSAAAVGYARLLKRPGSYGGAPYSHLLCLLLHFGTRAIFVSVVVRFVNAATVAADARRRSSLAAAACRLPSCRQRRALHPLSWQIAQCVRHAQLQHWRDALASNAVDSAKSFHYCIHRCLSATPAAWQPLRDAHRSGRRRRCPRARAAARVRELDPSRC